MKSKKAGFEEIGFNRSVARIVLHQIRHNWKDKSEDQKDPTDPAQHQCGLLHKPKGLRGQRATKKSVNTRWTIFNTDSQLVRPFETQQTTQSLQLTGVQLHLTSKSARMECHLASWDTSTLNNLKIKLYFEQLKGTFKYQKLKYKQGAHLLPEQV